MTATDTRRTAGDISALADFGIEVPSWAYGNSGTRFKVFATAGVPRDPYEKIEDAAQVHRVTGAAPRVSLHIPWDHVDDFGKLAAFAADQGCRWVRSTPTYSRTTTTSWGRSPTPTRRSGRRRSPTTSSASTSCGPRLEGSEAVAARRHQLRRPGFDPRPAGSARRFAAEDLRRTRRRSPPADRVQVLRAVLLHHRHPRLGNVAAALPGTGREGTGVLDTGHHAPGTNIEFIVAQLIRQGRLGAFDFNSRFYADDDLIVGSADRSSCSGSCTRSSGRARISRTPG